MKMLIRDYCLVMAQRLVAHLEYREKCHDFSPVEIAPVLQDIARWLRCARDEGTEADVEWMMSGPQHRHDASRTKEVTP